MKYKYTWTHKSNDEIWRGGPCDTIKECIEEAKAEDYQDTDTIAIGYAIPYEVDYIDGDLVIEYLQQTAYDEIGEVTDGWLDYITREQREDLNNKLLKVVLQWLKDCKEEPDFYKVEAFDELTIQEALKKYGNKTTEG